jgi:hypothetical protein
MRFNRVNNCITRINTEPLMVFSLSRDEKVKMESVIEKEYIICGSCHLKFERDREYRNCSNCFACTGCEIYYCPRCNNEIVVIPQKPFKGRSAG